MTVPNTNCRVSYVGTNTTPVYPYVFQIFQAADLVVQTQATATSLPITLLLNVDYTVAGVGVPAGGGVALTAGNLGAGVVLSIFRDPAQVQGLLLQEQSAYDAQAVMGGLDLGTMTVLAVQDQVSRSFTIPATDRTGLITALPPAAVRAGGFLGFDSFGNAQVTQTGPGVPPASWVNVKSFGAKGNGTSDDTTPIQLCINAVALTGGTVYFPSGTYLLTSGLSVTDNNVVLQGAGGWLYHDGGTQTFAGTKLQLSGGSPAAVISFASVNTGSNPRKSGMGCRDMWIDGGGTGNYGLYILSVQKCVFDNVHVSNVINVAYEVIAYTSVGHPEAMDVQSCVFSQLTWRMIDSSAVQNAAGITLTSSVPATDTANVSYNQFILCSGQTWNSPGIVVQNADNNLFINCRAFVSGTMNLPGLLIQGLSPFCDSNMFQGCAFDDFNLSGNGYIKITGTASGGIYNPIGNTFICMDDSNGTKFPTLDAGCDCQWHAMLNGWQELRFKTGVTGTGAIAGTGQYSGTTALIGTSTQFTNYLQPGVSVNVGGETRTVQSVTDDTHATMTTPFTAAAAGQALSLNMAPAYARTIYGTASPTTRFWNLGDRCVNSVPAVGSPKGWTCTVQGIPGTWVSDGNL